MRHSGGGALVDASGSCDLRLHFGKAHAKSAHFYELIPASFDPEISVVVTAGEVAGLEPAVSKLARRGLGIIEVPRADRRASHLTLADFPLAQLAAFFIHDADRQIIQRLAGTARLFAQAIRRQTGNARRGLGLPIHDKELRRGHDGPHLPDTFRSQRAAGLKEAAKTGKRNRSDVRAPEQDIVNSRYARERRTAVCIYRVKYFIGKHEP